MTTISQPLPVVTHKSSVLQELDTAFAPGRYLKVGDIAKLMNVPASTVYDLRARGEIPGATRFGRHIRFDSLVFQEWIEQGGSSSPENK